MTTRTTATLATALLALSVACGGSGATGETDTPIADIKAAAAEMDTAKLQATVDDYKAKIGDVQGKIEALVEQAKTDGAKGLGDALGGDVDKVKDLGKQVAGQADELKGTLKAMKDRLEVYVTELKSRTEG